LISKCGQSWKEIGWNGIRFSVPRFWEAGRVGERYMLLENDGFPVLELKWNNIRGKFSTEGHLKRFKSNYQKQQGGQTISSWLIPRHWQDLLKSYDVTGFQWKGNLLTGKGLILFCKDCRCATFLQFYERRDNKKDDFNLIHQEEILSSFQDHISQNDLYLWSVYDIRTMLPQHFKLSRHSFSPGAFEMTFDTGVYTVSFYRWSPASVILLESDLQDFAEKVFPFKSCRPVSELSDNVEAIELESFPLISFWRKWRQKLRKKPMFKWARVWHISSANRILAVKAESDQPLDFESLNSICSEYGVI
jgi:hypothetical protein